MSTQSVSIRDHMVMLASNGRSFFDALKSLNVSDIELQIDPDFTTPHVHTTEGGLFSVAGDRAVKALKNALSEQDVRVSALLLMTDFSSDKADEHVQWTVRAADVAGMLGAQAIRVDPLTRNKELPREQVRDNFIRRIKEALHEMGTAPIDLGIENHGPYGNDPVFLDEVFHAVNDSRLGMTLDTGNFYWWGVPLETLYDLLGRYAPRTKHTHIKNINYPSNLATAQRPIGLDYGKYCCPLDEGNIDLRRVVRILRDAGYRRDHCIENESLGKYAPQQKLDVLRRDVLAVKIAIS